MDRLEIAPKSLYGRPVYRVLTTFVVKLGFDSQCAYLCNFCRKPSKNYTKGLMVLSLNEDTSWHISRDADVGMTTCCQTGVRFSLCLSVLKSLRGLVRLSARISTGTGAYFKLLIFDTCQSSVIARRMNC